MNIRIFRHSPLLLALLILAGCTFTIQPEASETAQPASPLAASTPSAGPTISAQAAAPDNRFQTRDLTITLDGTFTATAQFVYPAEGDGPWPVVVLFAGSGPYDLDATYSPNTGGPAISTNFKFLAHTLAQQGIASLRYNKRGVLAYGRYDWEQVQQASVNQLIADAESVLAAAQAQPETDPDAVFLYGWSEGAVVATHLAAAHPDLAGLILQAPPNAGLGETLAYQQLEVALPYLREVVDADQDGRLSLTELTSMAAGPGFYLTLFYIWGPTASPQNPVFQEGIDQNGDGLIDIDTELLPRIEQMMPVIAQGYDAVSPPDTLAEVVAGLEMPVLILHGDMDGWVSLEAAQAIADAAPSRVTLLRYPDLGHGLSVTARPAEDVFGPMALEPVEDVVAWVRTIASQ